MERLFNLKHAPDMDEDRLPDMFFQNGGTVLTPTVMAQMLLEFYTAMGWDEKGRPLKETLAALDVEPVAFASRTVPAAPALRITEKDN